MLLRSANLDMYKYINVEVFTAVIAHTVVFWV
jgi:hypothetical protein